MAEGRAKGMAEAKAEAQAEIERFIKALKEAGVHEDIIAQAEAKAR